MDTQFEFRAQAQRHRRRASVRPQPTERQAWASIMIGHKCVGHIIGRGPLGIKAFDVNDKSLGLFSTQAAAADALGRLLLQEPPQ
jgi:hypothetical protein